MGSGIWNRGNLILVTDRDDWSTAEIIRTYRGQAHVEAVFAHLKDPMHVMLRPQYHWTDQKLHGHVFTCVLSYLLARVLHLQAQQAVGYTRSIEQLLDGLEKTAVSKNWLPTHLSAALRVLAEQVNPPPGEAPASVRAAWIGLELPLIVGQVRPEDGTAGRRNCPGHRTPAELSDPGFPVPTMLGCPAAISSQPNSTQYWLVTPNRSNSARTSVAIATRP